MKILMFPIDCDHWRAGNLSDLGLEISDIMQLVRYPQDRAKRDAKIDGGQVSN